MIVTEDFIEKNRTDRGGFTKRQVEILGFSWPYPRGWEKQVVGKEISDADAQEFCTTARLPMSRTQLRRNRSERRREAGLADALDGDCPNSPRISRNELLNTDVIRQVVLQKSVHVQTRIQLVDFAGRRGISIRDFRLTPSGWRPARQGVWIPLEKGEPFAAGILAVMDETNLTSLVRENAALEDLFPGGLYNRAPS